jgi:hypothetical protein
MRIVSTRPLGASDFFSELQRIFEKKKKRVSKLSNVIKEHNFELKKQVLKGTSLSKFETLFYFLLFRFHRYTEISFRFTRISFRHTSHFVS